MEPRRDVGVVLSGGGVNGVLMELGFLQRLRESLLWPRVGAIFGASAGALTGSLAALDRLDELEAFMMKLQPEQTFRLNRLWRLPFLGLYDYALPKTIDDWFGSMSNLTADLTSAPIELVVVATDLTDDDDEPAESGFELVYSSWTTPYDVFAQAVLASAAVSALVLPVRVGDRIATDGAWVRNYPLAHAYDHASVELIVAFRYSPRYPRLGVAALQPYRKRLLRFRKIPPIRAFLAEIDEAEARAARGEPAHLADMIVRLARVTIRRNTLAEERIASATDTSLSELRSLRHDVLGLVEDATLRRAIDERFAEATFPFRKDRLVPRIVVRGEIDGPGLEPGMRSQPHWGDDEKRALIRRGWELADAELAAIAVDDASGPYTAW